MADACQILGYTLYRGTAQSTYTTVVSFPTGSHDYVFSTVSSGNYYCAVTAWYAVKGGVFESGYSNEVFVQIFSSQTYTTSLTWTTPTACFPDGIELTVEYPNQPRAVSISVN